MAWQRESLTYDLGYEDLCKLNLFLGRMIGDAIKHKMKDDAHIAITIGRSQVADQSPIYKLTVTDYEDSMVELQSPE